LRIKQDREMQSKTTSMIVKDNFARELHANELPL